MEVNTQYTIFNRYMDTGCKCSCTRCLCQARLLLWFDRPFAAANQHATTRGGGEALGRDEHDDGDEDSAGLLQHDGNGGGHMCHEAPEESSIDINSADGCDLRCLAAHINAWPSFSVDLYGLSSIQQQDIKEEGIHYLDRVMNQVARRLRVMAVRVDEIEHLEGNGQEKMEETEETEEEPNMLHRYDQVARYYVMTHGTTRPSELLNYLTMMRQHGPFAGTFCIRALEPRKTIQIKVLENGIKCNGCVRTVKQQLQSSIRDADISKFVAMHADLDSKVISLFYRPEHQVSQGSIVQELESIGKKVTAIRDETSGTHLKLRIDGMSCQNCVRTVTQILKAERAKEGDILDIKINVESKLADIYLTPGSAWTAEDIAATLSSKSRYTASPVVDSTDIELRVEGMKCNNCVNTIQALFEPLMQQHVLGDVVVDLANNKVSLHVLRPRSLTELDAIHMINSCTQYKALSRGAPPSVEISMEQDDRTTSYDGPMQMVTLADIEDDDNELSRLDLQITGMTCASCAGKIERSVSGIKGVKKSIVNLMAQQGTFLFDKSAVTDDHILQRVKKLGYGVKKLETELLGGATEGHAVLRIAAMKTVKHAHEVEQLLQAIKGVANAGVETMLDKSLVKVEFDEKVTCARFLVEQFNSSNYAQTQQIVASVYSGDSAAAQDMRAAILRKKEIQYYKWMFLFCLTLTVPNMVIMMVLFTIFNMQWLEFQVIAGLRIMSLLSFVLSTPVVFIGGYKFYKLCFKALRNRSVDMNTLITIAVWEAYLFSLGSVIYGMVDHMYMPLDFFEAAASLIMFLLLGRWLENIAKSKSSQALVALMDLGAKDAVLLDFGPHDQEKKKRMIELCERYATEAQKASSSMSISIDAPERKIDVELLATGDIVKVLPGSKIPCDGIVLFGSSEVNEAMITGESVPVHKKFGDDVIGGTIVLDGMLLIKAMRVGSNSTLSFIAKLVQDAQGSKPKIQEVGDKISRYFVPVIIAVSLLTLAVWLTLGLLGVYPNEWLPMDKSSVMLAIEFSVAVVVIACPCALGLATPAAIMVGTGVAAKQGVLIKGGAVIEHARNANVILFDKTGTLTTGAMAVNQLIYTEDLSQDEKNDLLIAVAAAESASEHPIAVSIRDHIVRLLNLDSASIEPPAEFASIAGRGVRCHVRINGQRRLIIVGNRKLMMEERVSMADNSYELVVGSTPQTLIFVALDSKLACVFGVSDQLKPESHHVVRHLQKKLGLEVHMLTGDRSEVAHYVAGILGIRPENVHAECSPNDKQDMVKKLQAVKRSFGRKSRVIMVGDGINDSPSLAAADVGMAIGGSGTEVASEAADVVLLNSSITSIVNAITISKVVYRRVVLNFMWAFGYNAVLVPLAAGLFYPLMHPVIIPPWAAGVAMIASSLSVLMSSLALRLYRKPALCRKFEKEQLQKHNEQD